MLRQTALTSTSEMYEQRHGLKQPKLESDDEHAIFFPIRHREGLGHRTDGGLERDRLERLGRDTWIQRQETRLINRHGAIHGQTATADRDVRIFSSVSTRHLPSSSFSLPIESSPPLAFPLSLRDGRKVTRNLNPVSSNQVATCAHVSGVAG